MKDEISRTKYYDYLRVFATFSVIMLHLASQNWYDSDVNGLEWKIFHFYNSIVRWGVPVFVMISGSLFLERDIPISKIYSKYVLRMLLAFAVWNFTYFLFSGEGILQQFQSLFQEGKTQQFVKIINIHYHLWFIPMIAGIYICLPMIKQIVQNETVEKYYLAVSFIFWLFIPEAVNLVKDFGSENVIAIVKALEHNVVNMYMNMVMSYVFYFVLGHYLSNRSFDKVQKCLIYFAGLIGFVFTFIMPLVVSIKAQEPVQTYYDNTCVNVCLEAVAFFTFFKSLSFKEGKLYDMVVRLSKWSFGAYLVHVLIIDYFNNNLGLNTFSFSPFISVPVLTLAVFMISFGISALLNQIPIVKKYIV